MIIMLIKTKEMTLSLSLTKDAGRVWYLFVGNLKLYLTEIKSSTLIWIKPKKILTIYFC